MQITPKLYLQFENCNTNLVFLANIYGKGDTSISLGNSRKIRDIDGVKILKLIEKKTRTWAICLPQRLCN